MAKHTHGCVLGPPVFSCCLLVVAGCMAPGGAFENMAGQTKGTEKPTERSRYVSGPTIPIEKLPADASPEVQGLIRKLYSPSVADRILAAGELAHKGEAAHPAIPFLVSMLGDSSGSYEWEPAGYPTDPGSEAAHALARMGDVAVEPLIEVLRKSGNEWARVKAAEALGWNGSAESVNGLYLAVKDRSADVRRVAVEGILGLKPIATRRLGLDFLAVNMPGVKREMPPISDMSRFINMLTEASAEPDYRIRRVAFMGLTEVNAPADQRQRVYDVFVRGLDESDDGMRYRSVEGLRALGDKRALKPLSDALKKEKLDYLRRAFSEAIEHIRNLPE